MTYNIYDVTHTEGSHTQKNNIDYEDIKQERQEILDSKLLIL